MNSLGPLEIVKTLETLQSEGAGEEIYNSGTEFLRTMGLKFTNNPEARFKVGLALRGIPVSFSPNYSIRRALPDFVFQGKKADLYYYTEGKEKTFIVRYCLKKAAWTNEGYREGDYRKYSFSWGDKEK